MKSSVNIYFILLVLIFILFKRKRKGIKKVNNIKENFSAVNKRDKYKSGKYLDSFRLYKGTSNNNLRCESRLIGDEPPSTSNEPTEWVNHHQIEAQPYDDLFKGLTSDQTIDHPSSADGAPVANRCKAQYSIYLDERFPQKPYAALNRLKFKGAGELDQTEFSLSYDKNIHEKNKLEDYVVVPLPNVTEVGGEKKLSDEPIYVLLRYKNKPINANWGLEDQSHTGYCNNYVNCSGNMHDYTNPKCFDVKPIYEKEKRRYTYYQNGTKIA